MAVRISRGLLLSASGNSSTPFLFQTRTLAPLSQSLHRSFTRGVQQYSTEHLHENSSSTKIGDRSSDSSPEGSASNTTAERPFTRRSYLRKRGVAISQAKDQSRDQQSSPKPFETITSYSYSTEDSSNESSAAASELSHDSHKESASSSQAKDAPASSRSFIRRRASSIARSKATRSKQPSSSSKKPLQTMTPHEKLIFADLLGQLDIKRGGNLAKTGEDPGNQAAKSPSERGNPESINELVAMFDSILDDAQEKEKRAPVTKTETKPLEEASASADVPSDTHKIRLSEVGFLEPASGSREETMITVEEAVEMVVKREARKVEFELFQAIEEGKGDIGLWDVCKERIFTMLQHLDETAPATEPQPSLAGFLPDAPPTTDTEQPESKASSGTLNIPDIVPISPVVVKLYPKTLLIAFRLLNTHFPDSQLLSQFRSAIKAQGRSSAVLGTSTALFEEMIYFYWHGCHDLPAVVSFLRDMELHGLNMSDKSRTLLKDIVRERYRDLKAARASGEEDDPFWDLPPNRKAFEELAAPGGWLDRMKRFAVPRHRSSGSAHARR